MFTRTVTLDDLNTQPLLYLPTDFVASFPDHYEAEFRQVAPNVMELRLVDPKTPAKAKRYSVVKHNGATWTSIPKAWLRDRGARSGDQVLLAQSITQDSFSLHLVKLPRT